MKHNLSALKNSLFILAAAFAVNSLHAGTPTDALTLLSASQYEQVVPDKSAPYSPYVPTEDLGILYRNSQNPIIQKFGFTGEFQLQYANGESNQGSFGSRDLASSNRWGDIDVRRWRVGFASDWFRDFTLLGTIDITPQVNPFYKDIYDLNLTYHPSEAFNLSIGKTKARWFTQEFETRSRDLIVFEQGLLVNTLIPQQLTGAWITGKSSNWVYALAGFGGDYQNEFTRFNAGSVIQADIGYNFASALKADTALVKFDYQSSTSPANNNGPGKFSNAFSLNTTYQQGRFYAYTDLLGGIGQGKQGDVYGVELTPTYFLIEHKLQLIFRYQYAHGDNEGLNLQNRYEALAPGVISSKGAGSDYNAAYFGLNYYIHGHNLKLMAGTEFNSMTGGKQNYNGWTTLIGLRAAF